MDGSKVWYKVKTTGKKGTSQNVLGTQSALEMYISDNNLK